MVCTVWYVLGDRTQDHMPTLFRFKIQAEYLAKELFPDESPEERLERIQSKEVT